MDKLEHFIVTMAVYIVFVSFGFWVGLIASILWAIGKEVFDWLRGGKFDLYDLLADFLGLITAIMLKGASCN